MNIQKYLAFLRTVECGSFTKAAESLNYTQSGISRMIADLEAEWGLSLLERSRAGVKITPDGAALFPHIKRMCAEHQSLTKAVDDIRGLRSGSLRIGSIPSFAAFRLAELISAFKRDNPEVDFSLVIANSDELISKITDEEIELAVICLPTDCGLNVIHRESEELLAVMPSSHPLAKLKKVPIDALMNEDFILFNEGSTQIQGLPSMLPFEPENVLLTTSEHRAILSMISSSLGVSILPRMLTENVCENVSVRELEAPLTREIGFVMRNAKTASLAAHRFAEYLGWKQA